MSSGVSNNSIGFSENFRSQSNDLLKKLPTKVSSTGISASSGPIGEELSKKIIYLFNQFKTASLEDKKEVYHNLKAVFLKLEDADLPDKLRILTKHFRAYATILEKIDGFSVPVKDTTKQHTTESASSNVNLKEQKTQEKSSTSTPEIILKKQITQDPSFAGKITREIAEKLLNKQEGWLLRNSGSTQTMYLSYIRNGKFYEVKTPSLDAAKSYIKALNITTNNSILTSIKETREKEIKEHPAYAQSMDTAGAQKILTNIKDGWILRYSENANQYTVKTSPYILCVKVNGIYAQRRVESLDDALMTLDRYKIPQSSAVDVKALKLKAMATSPEHAGAITKQQAKALLGNTDGWLFHLNNTTNTMYLSFVKNGTFNDIPMDSLEDTKAYLKTLNITQNRELLNFISNAKQKEKNVAGKNKGPILKKTSPDVALTPSEKGKIEKAPE